MTLTWPNADRTLIAKGHSDYEWVEQRPQRPVGTDIGKIGAGEPTGIVACGDGLDVIQALADQGALTEGSVRLLYIDPPFGSGKRFGHYADTLAEAAWLSMMRDRLAAILPFMSCDGSIWVHLDETKSHKARLILDDMVGADRYVATVVWQKRLTVESRTAISVAHDPILVYAPNGVKHWKTVRNRIAGVVAASNRDGDERGPWRDAPFTAPGYRARQQYAITNPAGHNLIPPRGRSWFATEPVFKRLLQEDRIWWTKDGAGQPRMKNFDIDSLQVPGTIWTGREVGTNDDAKRHLASIFPHAEAVFDTPKPESLLKRIMDIATNPGDLVVDLFAGSGSTASTALKMGRRWIAAERLPETVASVLLPRLAHVVGGGDPGGITTSANWAGGGAFRVISVPPTLSAGDWSPEMLHLPAMLV